MRQTIKIAGVALVLFASAAHPTDRTVALTFDDATRGDSRILDGEERTSRLVLALAEADVDQAMFFVTSRNTQRLGKSGVARLQAYTDAGHVLGNHSHSHQWLWNTDTQSYIADLDKAARFLDDFDNVEAFYRFPFLDEGRSLEKRDALRRALEERQLHNGYVTIDTYDWHLDSLAQEAHAAGSRYDEADLRDLYVDVILRSTEFYDAMAQEVLGRSPHHILLLHENDLAALYI